MVGEGTRGMTLLLKIGPPVRPVKQSGRRSVVNERSHGLPEQGRTVVFRELNHKRGIPVLSTRAVTPRRG